MISEEHGAKIRQALLKQVDSMNLSSEERDNAINQIESMPVGKLEEFMAPSCIFCSIAKGQVDAYKIMENNDAVVVLEINPISKGHAILIPKAHATVKDFSEAIFSLVHKAIQRINQVLKPQQINITSSETGEHAVINIMPIFGNETGKRAKASTEELEALANELRTEEKHEVKLAKIEKSSKKEKEIISEPEIIIEKAPARLP